MERSIKHALREAAYFLRSRGLEFPRSEAELLLSFLLNRERIYLYCRGEERLSRETLEQYWNLLKRRAAGEPLAYITGRKEFMGLSFFVQQGVLIPRPETEHLVEWTIKWLENHYPSSSGSEKLELLDLGTGCGNIAVSLAYYLPGARVTAVDLEEEALQLAARNAEEQGVSERVRFLRGSFWEALISREKFHVVISNPPYIPLEMLSQLSREVKSEPLTALNGGEDGLNAFRQIFCGARDRLYSPGLLALEIGQGQAVDVISLGRKCDPTWEVEVKKDYAGAERVLLFTRNETKAER